MEKLCQLFEAGSERVDLSDLPPHLISSCLKLYTGREGERFCSFSNLAKFPYWTMDYREREGEEYLHVCAFFNF